ncbi:MAG: ATP-binding protein [Thermacetogeniaceae bacterium]
MPEQKAQLIAKLTGVNASKRNYYTELKEKIREITKRNSQLEILNELARQISINTPLDQIIRDVSDRVKKIIPFDHISLLTFRDDKLYIDCLSPPDDACLAGIEIPREQGRALWNVRERGRQQLWIVDGDIEDQYLSELGVKIAVISPLFAQNKVFGLFVVASKSFLNYDSDDLAFLQQLANQLAICIKEQELFAEVKRAKVEWEATFRAVRDPILVVDREMRIFRFNQATAELSNIPDKEIIGKKCCEILCSSMELCQECAVRKALRTGETAIMQHRLDDGRVMEIHAYPSLWHEERLGVVIYAKDITENFKMQAQLLKAARLAALGEMAAGVAHELNTPLAVIIGDAQLLMRSFPSDDKRWRLLEDIKNCGLRCKQIVQGLLTFSRQEQFVFHPLFPNKVVEEALKLISYQIETNNIKLNVSLDQGIPKIAGNAQQLEQVVVNLLLNASQSFEGKDGKREICVRTGFDEKRNQVFIEVSDTGQGIPPENLSQIFDPFYTTKGIGKGTGLGLSVSLGIVQAHGGTIGVESKQGEGSIFTVYLPPLEEGEHESAN